MWARAAVLVCKANRQKTPSRHGTILFCRRLRVNRFHSFQGNEGRNLFGGLPVEPGTSPAAHIAVSQARSMVRAGKPPFTRGTTSSVICGLARPSAPKGEGRERPGTSSAPCGGTFPRGEGKGTTSEGHRVRPHPSALRAATSHGPNQPVLTGKCPLDIFPGVRTPKWEGRERPGTSFVSASPIHLPHRGRQGTDEQLKSSLPLWGRWRGPKGQSLPTAVGRGTACGGGAPPCHGGLPAQTIWTRQHDRDVGARRSSGL